MRKDNPSDISIGEWAEGMRGCPAMALVKGSFARIYVHDRAQAVATVSALTGEVVSKEFEFDGLELAVIGNVLVVAGREEVLDKYRDVQMTLLVSDLDATASFLAAHGATILAGPEVVPTGRNLTARHAGGAIVEYIELESG